MRIGLLGKVCAFATKVRPKQKTAKADSNHVLLIEKIRLFIKPQFD
jgi:hypothetical protein